MVGVVVKHITPRLVYTLDFIFTERGVPYRIVPKEEVVAFEGKLLAYGESVDAAIPHFEASTLLFEEGVRAFDVERRILHAKLEVLSLDGVADIFASIFYVLSRYEEYLSKEYDPHGRFPARASAQFRFGWIAHAVCDRWANFLLGILGLKGDSPFQLVPSFDIDNTFAYRYKKGSRLWLSVLRDLKNRDFKRMRERRSIKRGAQDPYDTFGKISEIQNKFPQTRLFWLVAPLGEKDRNVSPTLPAHQELMRRMDRNQTVGLHPGYVSNGNAAKIRKEKSVLEGALGRTVQASRQHFLRFRLPVTYRALTACGFTDEYSMGFAEQPGFRAGTARPFFWFDLETNALTTLKVHPFVYMDGTLNEYLELNTEESKFKIQSLYEEVRDFGGDFVFIWHNETIGDYQKWKGWSAVLDFTLNLVE
jgi:hypothetical protein